MTNPTPQPPAPKKDSTAAFPTHHNVNDPRIDGFLAEQGMTLRDWFAGQALASSLNSKYVIAANEIAHDHGITVQETIATAAYQYADALMEARKV